MSKKSIFLFLFFAGSILFNHSFAQVQVNIGVQPVWGPVGYDYVDYYYLPDVEAYYYVPAHQYIYEERGTWIRTSSLPVRFGSFDIYHSYKVVINEPKPYLHHNNYKVKYVSYKGKHDQLVIRDSHEEKYFVVKGHPEHDKWKGPEHSGGNHEQHKEQSQPQHSEQKHEQHNGGAHEQSKGGGHGQQKGGGHHKN